MSHITNIKLRVKNLDALAEAAASVGLELRRGQTTHLTYGGRRSPCLHALCMPSVPGAYEVGVIAAPDGGDGFDLVADLWQQHALSQAVGGPQFNRLRQEYAGAEAAIKMKRKLVPLGFTVKREMVGARMRLRAVRR